MLQTKSTDWQKLIYGNCNAQIAKLYKIVELLHNIFVIAT